MQGGAEEGGMQGGAEEGGMQGGAEEGGHASRACVALRGGLGSSPRTF